jgi:hypothetical protein
MTDATETTTTETTTSAETTAATTAAVSSPDGTQTKTSPEGEGETTATEAKPEPTPEELAQAARDAVPESADGYKVTLDEAAKASLGLTDDDPMVKALAEFGVEQKKPQGWLDDVLGAAAHLASKGLLDGAIDPEAEAAKLGENAAGRRREVEVFADALKAKGDGFDEEMHGELMSLSPTAAGIRLVEYLRKLAGPAGDIPAPSGKAVDDAADLKAKAAEMAKDPRYGNDRTFTAEADAMWKRAYPGAR